MECLHGKAAASTTTNNGTFWFCGESKRRVYKGYYYDDDEIHVYHIAEFTRKSCGRTRIGQIHSLAHQFFSQTLNYFAFLFAMQLSETAYHQR
jgi:hypothetical protein